MIGHMLIITPEGAHEHQHFAAPIPDPGVLQKAVGGYIEVVPLFDTIEIEGELHACVAFCNGDGKGRLRLNQRATFLWERALQRRKEEPRTLQEKDGGLADYLVGRRRRAVGRRGFHGRVMNIRYREGKNGTIALRHAGPLGIRPHVTNPSANNPWIRSASCHHAGATGSLYAKALAELLGRGD